MMNSQIISCKSSTESCKPLDNNKVCEDADGHIVYACHDVLYDRYELLDLIGSGTFGKVIRAIDVTTGSFVAIKIIRSIPKYREAAKLEYAVLVSLQENDPPGEWHCVPLLDAFDYHRHICFVFPLFGLSLYDFLHMNRFRAFRMSHVKVFAWQLFRAVAYMHRLGMVHTDLKPENILLEDSGCFADDLRDGDCKVPATTKIRLCDFGSTARVINGAALPTTIVSTRHYRAPEIILGHGWSYPCDMWSIGCILVELVTGSALFHTHDNYEHLAMMEKVLGPIPDAVWRLGSNTEDPSVVSTRCRPQYLLSIEAQQRVNNLPTLEAILSGAPLLLSLVRQLLVYVPEYRLSAKDAACHPFFMDIKPREKKRTVLEQVITERRQRVMQANA